jgi:hypothetical protein
MTRREVAPYPGIRPGGEVNPGTRHGYVARREVLWQARVADAGPAFVPYIQGMWLGLAYIHGM